MHKHEFAEKILMIRGASGLTQEEFARFVGVSKRSISAWENGDVIPKKTVRIKIAVLCGFSVNEFLLEEEILKGIMPSKQPKNGEEFIFQMKSFMENSK